MKELAPSFRIAILETRDAGAVACGSVSLRSAASVLAEPSETLLAQHVRCTRDCLLEPFISVRLEQVLDSMHLERVESVRIVSGSKNNERRVLDPNCADHVEAVHLGHLSI